MSSLIKEAAVDDNDAHTHGNHISIAGKSGHEFTAKGNNRPLYVKEQSCNSCLSSFHQDFTVKYKRCLWHCKNVLNLVQNEVDLLE